VGQRTQAGILVAPAVAAAPGEGLVDQLGAWVALVKPRIVVLVVFTAVVSCYLAANGSPRANVVLVLIASGALSAGGAAAFNHYYDRDIDARMRRTLGRPLPTGRVRQPQLVLVGSALLILFGVLLATTVNLELAGFELVGAFVYAIIYTLWLKRRTVLNIVIGGLAGSAAVLGGWAAIDPRLGVAPLLLSGVVFLWTPAHFWSLALARQSDYDGVRVPMLPSIVGARSTSWWVLIHILAAVAVSLWLGAVAARGPLFFVLAGGAGLVFGAGGLAMLRQPDEKTGYHLFKLSGPYLGLVFLGLFLDTLIGALWL